MTDLDGLLDAFVRTATLRRHDIAAYEEMLYLCGRLLGLDDAVIVRRGDDDRPEILVSTSGAAAVVEVLEGHTGEGPCTEALDSGTTVLVEGDDLRRRWPRIAPELDFRGFASVAALPFGEESHVACVFADRALTETDCAVVRALLAVGAARASVLHELWATSLLVAQLQEALDSRVVVEQAKGVVAERYDVPIDFAFRLLRDHARASNLKLHTLALDVVAGRANVPGPAAQPDTPPPTV